MSRFSRKPVLSLMLGRRVLCVGDAASTATPEQRWESPAQLQAALEALPRAAGWRILLGEAVARHFIVRPPSNARRLADLRAMAALRFEDLHGERAADWRIEGDWDAHRSFLCCAMPTGLLDTLRAAAATAGVGAPWIETAFCAAWNAAPRRAIADGRWGVHAGIDETLLVAVDGGRPVAIGGIDGIGDIDSKAGTDEGHRAEVDPRTDDHGLWRAVDRLATAWSLAPPSGLVMLETARDAVPRHWSREEAVA